ncbi:unannotated protein [freshwater metagenome]|uniref:Unannotated protein n=1 Tax=freshwater metagenome TaxID=449393 RepID=A0A6J6FSQ8_9ZZZZ
MADWFLTGLKVNNEVLAITIDLNAVGISLNDDISKVNLEIKFDSNNAAIGLALDLTVILSKTFEHALGTLQGSSTQPAS